MMQQLTVSAIRLDGGTQPRAQLNWVIISEYAESMQDGVEFPAVTVFYDGSDYWLADGFHRTHAAKQAELTTINADVRQGTRRDAVLYSVSANSQHGLRRTNEDKRRAVETLLRDDEWRKWSDNEVSRRCGVAVSFVGKVRKELSLFSENSEERTYTTKHGTTATMNIKNIGTKPAPAPVVLLAKEYGVTDVKAVDMLAQVSEKSPTLFDEIQRTGAILGLDGVDIPISEASATDIRLAADEEARERAIRHMMHQNGQMKPNGSTATATITPVFETNEWYTPPEYIDAARQVLGQIDTDPASSELANQTVKAATYYTKDDDGLQKEWPGHVWLNPPYGRDLPGQFVARLVQQYKAGITKQAIVLVNLNSATTKWFAPLWDYPMCIPHGRINFDTPDERENGSTHGSVLVYFGDNEQQFAESFRQFGPVVKRIA